ncbi:MAG TPA: MotA/TolQ/ExbB proton channel family protein [Pseudomonadales bacterium]|nr:MotA/TolQ/ExbB proton channel family protein [Pseudomonadales bacterium]
MFEILLKGGWLMLPIVLCSIIATAICIERSWALRAEKLAPSHLLGDVWSWLKNNQLDAERLDNLAHSSALGSIMAAGLNNAKHGREIMKESIQEVASQVVHDMERYLNTLGTIAAITPLLGLLGTVIGMIKVFNEIMQYGTGNVGVLAGGISEALITTAAGLAVAIPALIAHRHFTRKVDSLVVYMEQQTVKLVDALYSKRRVSID